MPQTQMLLSHIGLKPNQYSPLSKLKLACQIGDAEAVKELLSSGVDPLATGCPGDWNEDTPAIHHCIEYAQPACLEALLATGNLELLDQKGYVYREGFFAAGITPLSLAIQNIECEHYFNEDTMEYEETEVLECIKILLERGANISRLDLMKVANSDEPELISMLEDAASLRFSRLTHHKFPRPARAFAGETLRLGYQIASKIGSGALPSVWEEHVMPFLVDRTSRPMAYASDLEAKLAHRKNEVAIKRATRDTIVKDASLRAAMLDGSLTIRTVREAVVARLRLSADSAAELKTKYRDCIKAEFLSVGEAFQDSRIWPDVVEVMGFHDVGSNAGFEPGLVCVAVVKTSCGATYMLRTTKKCYRLSRFPYLRSDWLVSSPSRIPKKRRRRS